MLNESILQGAQLPTTQHLCSASNIYANDQQRSITPAATDGSSKTLSYTALCHGHCGAIRRVMLKRDGPLLPRSPPLDEPVEGNIKKAVPCAYGCRISFPTNGPKCVTILR